MAAAETGSVPEPLNDKSLKERYDYEIVRKEKLSDSLGMPVSVLIVLGGLIVTMIRGFSYTKFKTTVAFDVFVLGGAGSVVSCFWYFAHAYHGQTYEQLPSLGDLFDALKKYRDYYAGYDGPENAETDFEDNFRYRIIEAADRNTKSNNARQSCLHKGIVSLYALLVFTACLAVPYAIDQYLVPAKVPVMHIDNLERKEVLMPSQQPTVQPKPQAQSTPAGPKPQFPSNIVQKNDQTVKETRDK